MLRSKTRYYYTRLDTSSRSVYDRVLSAWEARDKNPSFSPNSVAKVDIQKVIKFISFDNPGLFYVDFSGMTISQSTQFTTVHSRFLYGDKQITDAETRLQNVMAAILSKPQLSSQDRYDKELALHDCLARNINYDDVGADTTNTTVVGALLYKKAVCEGYAKAFKLLCDQAGIASIVVGGSATPRDKPSEGHAWNIVKLDGVCAHVDVTWDSAMRAGKENCRDCFNITDGDIALDHVWDRNLLPPCTSTKNNWFYKNGCVAANDSDFKKYVAAKLKAGQNSFAVKLGSKHNDQRRVLDMVGDALAQNAKFTHVRSYTLRYNPVRGAAYITFS